MNGAHNKAGKHEWAGGMQKKQSSGEHVNEQMSEVRTKVSNSKQKKEEQIKVRMWVQG